MKINQYLEDMRAEADRAECLGWLQVMDHELIRVHKKLKTSKALSPEERHFLGHVVMFALGETTRADDEGEMGNN